MDFGVFWKFWLYSLLDFRAADFALEFRKKWFINSSADTTNIGGKKRTWRGGFGHMHIARIVDDFEHLALNDSWQLTDISFQPLWKDCYKKRNLLPAEDDSVLFLNAFFKDWPRIWSNMGANNKAVVMSFFLFYVQNHHQCSYIWKAKQA